MKFRLIHILGVLLLFASSCTTPYRKSFLYQEQEDAIKTLSREKQRMREEMKLLQQQLQLAEMKRDTIYLVLDIIDNTRTDSLKFTYKDTIIVDSLSLVNTDSLVIDTLILANTDTTLLDSLGLIKKDSTTLAKTSAGNVSFLDSLLRIEGQAAMRLAYKNATFDILILEKAQDIQLFWKKGNNVIGNFGELKNLAEKENKQLIFATNAGMYTPAKSPQGIYVELGKELIPLDTTEEAYGNFYMQPNGVFLIEKSGISRVIPTEEYQNYQEEVLYATQSGPMAVVNGKLNSHFNEGSPNVHIRSGVGVDPQGRTIFLISNQRINLFTFGSIFKDIFQCQNALYLDGAISQMYLPAINRNQLGGDFGPLIGVMKEVRNK